MQTNLLMKVRKPDRVIITDEGLAVPPRRAVSVYGTGFDVVFIRKDGWTLGAPRSLERVAFQMWEDEWEKFSRIPFTNVKPITEYERRQP